MDRLHPLIVLLALTATSGCDNKPSADAPQPKSRVNAVKAKPKTAQAPADFCDLYQEDASAAAALSYPELDGEAPPGAIGWKWINVWATWCKPCIEEMPRLAAWEGELSGAGLGDVVFVSADDSAKIVDDFRAKHPDTPDSVRLQDPDSVGPWLEELGYTGPSSLPVHIFVDGSDKVRCIRVGGVNDRDKPAVERLVGG